MNWKFWEREEQRDYTTAIIEAYFARANAVGLQSVLASKLQSAIETCSGLYARAFSLIKLEPEIVQFPRRSLAEVGRRLVVQGESIWSIERGPTGLEYEVVSTYDVRGGPRPWYRLNISRPDQTVVKDHIPADDVLHFKFASDPVQPWIGIGPLALSQQTVSLLAVCENQLTDEMKAKVGKILPQPSPPGSEDVEKLTASLKDLAGRIAVVQSQRSSWGQSAGTSGKDWQATHLGAEPAAATVDLHAQIELSVFRACGVPPGLLEGGSEQNIRDSWRSFLASTISPLASLLVEEISDKLGVKCEYDLAELKMTDIATLSRAVGSLSTAGLDLEQALEVAGLRDRISGSVRIAAPRGPESPSSPSASPGE